MPFIRCVYSGDAAVKDLLLSELTKAIATSMGKSEAVVMCHVEHSSSLMFGASMAPSSMIQVESIGSNMKTIIGPLTEVMMRVASIEENRCFYNFRDVEAESFGKGTMTIAEHRAAATVAAASVK